MYTTPRRAARTRLGRLGTVAEGHQFLVRTPRRRSRPEYSQERLRRIGVGIQVLGAELFAVSQAADPHPAPLQVVDVAHGVQPHRPGSQQLLALGFRVAARQLMDSGAADIDVAVGLGRRSPSPSIWCLLRYTFVTHTWTS